MREALAGAPAPVVAVSPFVEGQVLKGPTRECCAYAGIEPTAAGVAKAYAEVVDGMVADEHVDQTRCLTVDSLMVTPERRRRVATTYLDFAVSVGG